ncbi:MAG: hypothetical protein LUQ50_13945 [Methanospirillum sp.]|uniref:hypothetical protein n=1 Tax=Methanospirillum sp. TaxID=45200 RepID=UPI0023736BF1|nr:hypothetical protein [Methanospirillum sp.]MDD1730157.1 hypothetical protein [Methanospirillum sp.]
MNKLQFVVILGLIILSASVVSAIDFTGWKQIEVNESLINSTSSTNYTVMVPPGYTNNTIDSPIGVVTSFVNQTDPNSLISIIVIDNEIGEKLNDKNSKLYLDNFMLGANISPINGTEPNYLSDGGIVDYGTSGDEIDGIYILSTDEKVMIVTGMYNNIDSATAGVENLALIAGTISIVSPTNSE